MRRQRLLIMSTVAVLGLAAMGQLFAARISDIAGTRHNLSVSGTGAVRATTESEICVFCHTPHGATSFPGAPLWNRQLSNQTYTVYTSSSLDAQTIAGQLAQPAGSSKLCMSCHDGTLALGAVNVLGGQLNRSINLSGTGAGGTMPPGAGGDTGFTRNLGADLRNDHPISFTYDSALAIADGELLDPAVAAHIGVGVPGTRPPVPLERTGPGGQPQLQCGSCHDPHIRDSNPNEIVKFLRLNRFQATNPVGGLFSQSGDSVCLACHDKRGWATSAHADFTVADETYTTQAAQTHQFPELLPVWRAACLNCHDPHTVHGARRLAREGTDSLTSPKSGGNSAIEETCYQCHSSAPIVSNTNNQVRDIRSEFLLPRRMPITSTDQRAAAEVHDIRDSDFTEPQTLLGKISGSNRHAECTDCHNPHRVTRNRLFNATGDNTRGAHAHATTTAHTNIASGVLRGSWGVEPLYSGASFLSLPLTYEIKRGDGGNAASTALTSPYVTREYQVCLKCHSDYGYNDTGAYPLGGRPNPGDAGGGTPSGTNNLTQFTNQAMELQAPLAHRGEVTTTDSGAGGGFSTNNHRSWHPVIDATGRTAGVRNMSAASFVAPWNNGIGTQTMYCSDCHGGNSAADSVVPSGNRPWGPHGSENDFILKGTWSAATGSGTRDAPGPTDPANGVCFKCHDYRTYADRNGNGNTSGFRGSKSDNLHAFHTDKIERMRCSWCHTAVPHGWKNKALLVNLNDLGPEAGNTAPVEATITNSAGVYNQGPYYMNAKLKILTFATSGNWEDTNCGSASGQGGTGRSWMENVCTNPP